MHRTNESTVRTKSAALLAAEAAFAPPRQSNEQLFAKGLPAITVLRMKRTAALADRMESGQGEFYDAWTLREPQLPELKAPRVFLVGPAHGEFGSAASEWPKSRAQREEAGPAVPTGLDGAASTPVRRARRSRNRPLPVTLVFSAADAAGSDVVEENCHDLPASPARAQGGPPANNSASLAAALGAIEPTFVAISAAMGFTVEDPQVSAQWEHLSRELEQLAVEIRAASESSSRAAPWV